MKARPAAGSIPDASRVHAPTKQRLVARAIKNARETALLPYTDR